MRDGKLQSIGRGFEADIVAIDRIDGCGLPRVRDRGGPIADARAEAERRDG